MIISKSIIEIESFAKMWAAAFPDALPLAHLLKHQCTDCWFRIHSLPESKRYAENSEEYEMILSRQNEVATDILGENTKVYIIAGEYDWEVNQAHVVQYDGALKVYDFCILDIAKAFDSDQIGRYRTVAGGLSVGTYFRGGNAEIGPEVSIVILRLSHSENIVNVNYGFGVMSDF